MENWDERDIKRLCIECRYRASEYNHYCNLHRNDKWKKGYGCDDFILSASARAGYGLPPRMTLVHSRNDESENS